MSCQSEEFARALASQASEAAQLSAKLVEFREALLLIRDSTYRNATTLRAIAARALEKKP